ncbi:MAG TPA: hypothetical protein ENL20_11440 [Candidatus Cloacimonetes bacterium]|nr:hypothetical protein [Candidatus Cloacimonadota bacterium]
MVNVKEKVYAEFEFIEKILKELEIAKDNPDKELVVIVGISAYLQNIYMGIENILKQLLKHKRIPIPNTSTWHKDLINSAIRNKIIKEDTANKIGKYLFFRHFFTHAYSFQIDEDKLKTFNRKYP